MDAPPINGTAGFRPLLPRPREPSDDDAQHSVRCSNIAPSRRKFRVLTACQGCRLRKMKCDGDRPECGPCQSRAQSCVYRVEISRENNLVGRQQALQENVESFVRLYRYLQERPANEANKLFERIRNGFGIEAALEFVKTEESNLSLADRDPPSARVEWSQQIHDCNLLFENELVSSEVSDVTVQALRDGVDCYFSYLGTMFPIYTKNEVDMIITTFPGSQSDQEAAASDQRVSRKIAYGELLAICALGFQYDRQTLPDGNASICTPFYKKARLVLDYVVEKAPLHAMRICCCLGIYNVIAKSSLAISYTDRGILLGSSSGLGVGKRPPSLSDNDFSGFVKTFRALITVRSWVTATLGHIPSPEVSRCIHETREQMDNTGNLDCTGENLVIDKIQQNMAQITVLKANVLRTVACFRVLSPAILRQMREDLELWRSSLPVYMRLETLVQSPKISPDQRRVTFYMHLFYMSALILKARALLATQGEMASCSTDPEATAAILEGVQAARSSARLLGLIYEENAVVKNCWLTIYQCYVTFLTLNYTAIKSFLVRGATAFRQPDIVLSGKCMEILALCATKDRIARSFHVRLSKYQSILKECLPKSTDNGTEGLSPYDDNSVDESYLFVKAEGNTELHRLMHEILEMLCYPLTVLKGSTDTEMRYPTIVEASVNADINFAHHLASPFNMAEDEVPVDLFPPGDNLGECCGYENEVEGYVSGSVPYGWDVSAWTRDPGVGGLVNT